MEKKNLLISKESKKDLLKRNQQDLEKQIEIEKNKKEISQASENIQSCNLRLKDSLHSHVFSVN